jgi:hypothetical protein
LTDEEPTAFTVNPVVLLGVILEVIIPSDVAPRNKEPVIELVPVGNIPAELELNVIAPLTSNIGVIPSRPSVKSSTDTLSAIYLLPIAPEPVKYLITARSNMNQLNI